MYTAWAKLKRDDEGQPSFWRSLPDHCMDVAAVLRGLLEMPVLRGRLARLAGLSDLTSSQRDRLAVLAGLHDLGKANRGFQNKAILNARYTAGHLGEALAVLGNAESKLVQQWIQAADLATLAAWFEAGEDGLVEALYALFSHHGQPIQPPDAFPAQLWRADHEYDPLDPVRETTAALKSAFPGAREGKTLPAEAPFMHGFLGLITLADWIASDERFFPLYPLNAPRDVEPRAPRESANVALRRVGLVSQASNEPDALNSTVFRKLFGFYPRPAQDAVIEEPLPHALGSLHVLEADTGSGKTEVALAWFYRLFQAGLVEGLYFALPTRAAAAQIHARVERFARQAFGAASSGVLLAVPGYTPAEGTYASGIREDRNRFPDQGGEWDRTWAAEHPKRYLVERLVVGTVDQALLSGLQVKHSHMRAVALLRHLLVVDEVHASDAYMTRILEGVLKRHRAAGGHALLLSATLAAAGRARLLAPGSHTVAEPADEAIARPYPAWWSEARGKRPSAKPVASHGFDKALHIVLSPCLTRPDEAARTALQAAAAGARVGILRNTVRDAVATQRALEAAGDVDAPLFRCQGVPAPHHGRFAREDRLLLDRSLEARVHEPGPLVVAATQTIEQSLDIDFDLLITDLCPMDVLLQRLGRLHRHERQRPVGFERPVAHVLVPDGDLSTYLGEDGKARGPGGLGAVYGDLVLLEGTLAVLRKRPVLHTPSESRFLIETALHPDKARRRAQDRGGSWMAHWASEWGRRMAHESTAGINEVDWWQPLSRTRFTEPGEIVRTRLGTDSRRLLLPKNVCGPFGCAVSEITVPGWMAGGLSAEPEISIGVAESGVRILRADQRLYRYDRFGLRPDGTEDD